ncbi:4Fe-4S dicluster domain-containing protein [Desulfonema magnum]|uniref:4Fe-4S dicluster domain-containing protein n=1 Tax=Desulfonema magnum TaxID=45655 RepID=A0A975GN74_9BACT|nr:4Fe-4S dicluster domain-containing protein [Desulfonema magnum]QTA87464.1 4Fe-4S dicluster domain-containing protein [Desulfonema magnum]
MGDYLIYTDAAKCIACHSCEVACKAKNNVPEGATLGKIVVLGPRLINGQPRMSSLFVPCFHCEDAWCMNACPVDAIRKRNEDGLVYILQELCVGCKACILACPWHIPQWDADAGKAMKCDLCMDRIDEGQEPACVAACPTNALQFGEPAQLSHKAREEYGLSLLKRNPAK